MVVDHSRRDRRPVLSPRPRVVERSFESLRLSAMLGWLLLVIVLSAFCRTSPCGTPGGPAGRTTGHRDSDVVGHRHRSDDDCRVYVHGNGNASLARDAMFAVVMLVLNGMVGLSLLLGGCDITSRPLQSARSQRLSRRHHAVGCTGARHAKLYRVFLRPNILSASIRVPDHHVPRALRRVSRDSKSPAS